MIYGIWCLVDTRDGYRNWSWGRGNLKWMDRRKPAVGVNIFTILTIVSFSSFSEEETGFLLRGFIAINNGKSPPMSIMVLLFWVVWFILRLVGASPKRCYVLPSKSGVAWVLTMNLFGKTNNFIKSLHSVPSGPEIWGGTQAFVPPWHRKICHIECNIP